MIFEFPDDAVTRYAIRVVNGDVVAGPHVRDACDRHIRDLVTGADRGLTWHVHEVERVIEFFAVVLTVEVEYQDENGEAVSEAVPFELHESQEFIVGSLFGWRNKLGNRRFRRAYVEIAKGNGKSPLAAGIGHYMLGATDKLRAEVYSAATDKDQAAILFRDAVEMWRRSPALQRRLVSSGVNPVWQLSHMGSSSFFKPISSEKKGKSGIRPYCALIDEVHEHPNNDVIEMLRAGTKGNQQALMFEITNSGSSRDSVCWDEHEYTTLVCSGEETNDAWFGFICGLDEGDGTDEDPGDDPFNDESCWLKANPLLEVSIFPDFIREQVTEAQGMPSKESLVRRLHFCQWTEGEETWISRKVWERVESQTLRLEDYTGEECYGGLDLSYTIDLSAFALVFPSDDWWAAFVWFWKPKIGLNEAIKRDRVPYDRWHQSGYLELTEGRVIKLEPIAGKMSELSNRFDLLAIGYDNYRHRELVNDMLDLGIELPMVEHPQGFRRTKENPLWMPNSVESLENAIIEDPPAIRICFNPLLRYNAMQTVIRKDPAGTDNKIFDKRKSRARIDGIVALAMGHGTATVRPDPVFPVPLSKIVEAEQDDE